MGRGLRLFDELFRLRRRQHECTTYWPGGWPRSSGGWWLTTPRLRSCWTACAAAGTPGFTRFWGSITLGLPNGITPTPPPTPGCAPKQFLAAIFISLPFPTLLTCAAGSFILEGNWILTVLGGGAAVQFCGHSVLQPHPAHRPGAPTQRYPQENSRGMKASAFL